MINQSEDNARQCVAELFQEMKNDKKMAEMVLQFIYKVHPDLFIAD